MTAAPAGPSVQHRLQALGHYLTAVVFLLKGFSKLDHPQGYWGFIAFCWLAALAVAAVTALHGRLPWPSSRLQALVYTLESAVCFFLSFFSFRQGQVRLPYAWLLAASFLLVVALSHALRRPSGVTPRPRHDG